MSSHILGEKDVNAAIEQQPQTQTKDVKSMDYHRQVFQNKMAEEPYVYHKGATAGASSPMRWTTTTASSRFTTTTAANTNSSDASSCSDSESDCSSSSPVPSLIFDSPSSSSSPAPSITSLPRWPTNRILIARSKQYVSPSDNIMSPCTAKINALRNKHVSKAKPKSLFAQASAKKLGGTENLFGSKSIPKA